MNPSDAVTMAEDILAQHGLDGWAVELDTAKRRFGVCRYARCTIGLSRPLVTANDSATVRDVILHETAHALAGAGVGHGPRWRAIARSIGVANPRACRDGATVNLAAAPYRLACPQCGAAVPRYRRSRNDARWLCRRCRVPMVLERVA